VDPVPAILLRGKELSHQVDLRLPAVLEYFRLFQEREDA
jgi:hypothetical protein